MVLKKNTNFTYDKDPAFEDKILEEGPNSCVKVCKISWNGKPYKLDIRKYAFNNQDEIMMKGISISDDAANELANVLVEEKYGSTRRLLRSIKTRDDFNDSMLNPDADLSDPIIEDEKSEYYDAKQLLGLLSTASSPLPKLSKDNIDSGGETNE